MSPVKDHPTVPGNEIVNHPSETGMWLPIETAPTSRERMFVVQGFDVINGFTGGRPYTTDPWCVWREKDGTLARWPHHFPPTHWTALPAPPNSRADEPT